MIFNRKTLDNLYRYCLALTGQREDAEDLLHTALESYLYKKPGIVKHPVTYVRRIARNRYFDQLRRMKVVHFDRLEDPESYSDLEKNLERMLVDELTVERVWQTLNSAEREVVYLWAVEEMSASEIALHLNLPRGTVLSRLYRLRKRIAGKFSSKISGDRHD